MHTEHSCVLQGLTSIAFEAEPSVTLASGQERARVLCDNQLWDLAGEIHWLLSSISDCIHFQVSNGSELVMISRAFMECHLTEAIRDTLRKQAR